MPTTLKKGDVPTRRFSLLSFGDRKDETIRTQKRTAKSFVENKEKNTERLTVTHFAAFHNLKELLERRLQNSKHVQRELEARTANGETPLRIAVQQRHLETVKTLLDHGADIMIKERDGQVLKIPTTLLHEAIEQGDQERVQLLLNAKPGLVSVKPPGGDSAFTAAAKGEKFAILEVLLPILPPAQLQIEFAQSWFLKFVLPHQHLTETLLKAGAMSDALKERILYEAKELPHIWCLLLRYDAKINGQVHERNFLHKALKDNDIAFAELLLQHGADSTIEFHGKTPLEKALDDYNTPFAELLIKYNAKFADRAVARKALHVAAAEGNATITRFTLEKCERSSFDTLESHNLLKAAVASGQTETVRALLAHGIDPEARNDKKETAIFEAVRRKDLPMTRLLLEKMPDLDYGTNGCPQLLQLAARWNNKDILKTIVGRSRRSMAFLKDTAGAPLLIAAVEGNNHAALALINGGANINVVDSDGNTPLHFGVRTKNAILVALAIAKGGRLLTRNKEGMSPLHLAVLGNDTDVQSVCFLDWDTRPFDEGLSKELLVLALINGNHSAANLLLEHGLSPNVQISQDGHKPIHLAAAKGHVEIVRVLIRHGADINDADSQLRTPLWMVASCHNNTDIAELLLQANADMNLMDSKKRTPLWIALINDHLEIAKLLVEKGAKLTSCSKDGVTVLHLAVDTKNEDLVGLIISKAGDVFQKLKLVNAKTSGGNTALQIAIRNNSPSLITMLLRPGAKVDIPPIQLLSMASTEQYLPSLREILNSDPSLAEATHNRITLMTIALQHDTTTLLKCLVDNPDLRELPIGTDAKICPSSADPARMTPLMFAAAAGKTLHAVALLRAGANPNIDGRRFVRSPLHLAVMAQHANRYDIVGMLLAEGADPRERDRSYGHTPLHLAVIKRDRDMVGLLLRSQAGRWIVNIGNDRGQTALSMAGGVDSMYEAGADLIRERGGGLTAEWGIPGPADLRSIKVRLR